MTERFDKAHDSMKAKTSPDPGYPRVSDGLLVAGERLLAGGFEGHIAHLELYGYTVVEGAISAGEVEAISARLLELASEPDVDVDPSRYAGRTQEVFLLLMRGGKAFEDLILNPSTFPIITYLLGESCTLSSLTGYVKGAGAETALGVHSDTAYVPDPLPPYAQIANVNFVLSPYTVEDGCLSIVPGSHRYCHRPREGQGLNEVVPVEAPAGSAIVFHGNTWHGAYPRVTPGLRLTVSALYCRMYMRPQERYDEIVDEDVIERNPPTFRRLLGLDLPTGWRSVEDAKRIEQIRRGADARRLYRTRATHT